MIGRACRITTAALLALIAVDVSAQSAQGPRATWEAYDADRPTPRVPSIDQHLSDPILNGAIDLHAHFGPDSYQRQWDAFEIAQLMHERGMRGAVFKDHFTETAGLAFLLRRHAGIGDFEAFGGLALNTEVGGLNPQAVRYFAAVEGHFARIVWMPTHDSEHEVKALHQAIPFVSVSRAGKLLPAVLHVLDVVKEKGLTLATGHVSADEMLMIVAEAHRRGIEHIIITHPDLGPQFTDASLGQLQQAVKLGGDVEIVAGELFGARQAEFIAKIRSIGPAHCFISSDSGLVGTPNHADAFVMAIRILRKAGFSESELDLMFRRNPARLIGLAG